MECIHTDTSPTLLHVANLRIAGFIEQVGQSGEIARLPDNHSLVRRNGAVY